MIPFSREILQELLKRTGFLQSRLQRSDYITTSCIVSNDGRDSIVTVKGTRELLSTR